MDDNSLNERRTSGEGGNGEEMDEVFPGLLAHRGADREAGAPA